ncbi:hypothetical protein GOP47_0018848 [Adiantum capillus-veneris]|uniref:Protein kinase domain-containing protein n=1 Tax=Adiantum capillus-veneris TaxID=13818 RepID=A0A9D4UF81_ADICA|nr:hypothetical protein GOP47_0018848 [Adiantum capillus-veneris]
MAPSLSRKTAPILMTLALLHLLTITITKGDDDDGSVLLDFMLLADPSNSFNLWSRTENGDDDYCHWPGVLNCDDQNNVVSLQLDNFGLNGTLLQDLFSRLAHLEILSLRHNKLRGPIPPLQPVMSLKKVLLDHNELSGPIPPISLDSIPHLKEIDISYNKLNGTLPNLPYLSNLTSFDVSNNNLSGPIPSSLSHYDKSAFQGNMYLCGPPLDPKCRLVSEESSSSHGKSTGGFRWMLFIFVSSETRRRPRGGGEAIQPYKPLYMVLHGNLKSSNILLGPELEAQVVEFGMAALLAKAGAHAFMAGNSALECRSGARNLSAASDVYCYGVLLFELLTGKMPTQGLNFNGVLGSKAGIDLVSWVESVVREEWTVEVFDQEFTCSKLQEEELLSLLKLALACVSPTVDQRPSMSLILYNLSHIKTSTKLSYKKTLQMSQIQQEILNK